MSAKTFGPVSLSIFRLYMHNTHTRIYIYIYIYILSVHTYMTNNIFLHYKLSSSVIASNLLLVDEMMRAGRTSLKGPDAMA